MNLLVLLAGVADSRYALPPDLDAASLAAHRAKHPQLSPFDEAALECALKLRDAQPDTPLHALVGVASPQDAMMRHVAGFRLDTVQGLDLAACPSWDAVALASTVRDWIHALPSPPTHVLLGREFGDEDDGMVPGVLAEALGWPLLGQCLQLRHLGGQAIEVLRQQGSGLERLQHDGPAVVATVNHTGNRLRQPLLKNVMAARKQSFGISLPGGGQVAPGTAVLACVGVQPVAPPERPQRCAMLAGSIEEQAAALARALTEEAA